MPSKLLESYRAQIALIKVLGTQQIFWYSWLVFSIGSATGAVGQRHLKEYKKK
jgi:hypothetical protein